MDELLRGPLGTLVAGAERMLVLGAGGGFDVLAGLPLGLAAVSAGVDVVWANYSFTDLGTVAGRVGEGLARVDPDDRSPTGLVYYPELHLARQLRDHLGALAPVYALEPTGVRPLTSTLERLVVDHELDTVVLIDGGNDILLRGTERGLGTPHEDYTTLAAASALSPEVHVVVACADFGVDRHHRVADEDAWAAVDELAGDRADAVVHWPDESQACRTWRAMLDRIDSEHDARSNVQTAIAASFDRRYGRVPLPDGSPGSLPAEPDLAAYVVVPARPLAARNRIIPRMASSTTVSQVRRAFLPARSRREPRRGPSGAYPRWLRMLMT